MTLLTGEAVTLRMLRCAYAVLRTSHCITSPYYTTPPYTRTRYDTLHYTLAQGHRLRLTQGAWLYPVCLL